MWASSQSTRVEERDSCSLCTIPLHHSQVTHRTLCATIVMLPWAKRPCSRAEDSFFSLWGRGSRIDIKLGLIKNRRCVTLLILQGYLPAWLQIVSMASNAAQAWLSESMWFVLWFSRNPTWTDGSSADCLPPLFCGFQSMNWNCTTLGQPAYRNTILPLPPSLPTGPAEEQCEGGGVVKTAVLQRGHKSSTVRIARPHPCNQTRLSPFWGLEFDNPGPQI